MSRTDDLRLDVETRSVVDLRKTNLYVYFDDPSTDLWCVAFAFGDDEPELWLPGQPCPSRIAEHIETGGVIHAYNAAFERQAWNKLLGPKYGWPVPMLRQYRCTLAAAYSMALPGKLEHAAIALGIQEQKDQAGSRLMMKMARPRSPRKNEPPGIYWHDKPEEIARLGVYCCQDIRAERGVSKRLLPLSDIELETWFLDQEINDRGIYIDKPLCDAANKIVSETVKRLDKEMRQVTDGEVRGVSNVTELIAFVRKRGIETNSIAKDELINLLIRDDLPADVYRALQIRQEGAKASTAKINAMLARRQTDGRARGTLQYHAAGTGRWGGRGIQPQNLVRPSFKPKEIEKIVEDVLTGNADLVELLHGPPMSVVADCIRSMIAAEPSQKGNCI